MTEQRDRQQLRGDIEQRRRELGETVNALAHKADVRARAQEKKTELQQQARQKGTDLQQQARQKGAELKLQAEQDPAKAVGAVLVLLALIALMRWRKRR